MKHGDIHFSLSHSFSTHLCFTELTCTHPVTTGIDKGEGDHP